jgi:hypothetical protein
MLRMIVSLLPSRQTLIRQGNPSRTTGFPSIHVRAFDPNKGSARKTDDRKASGTENNKW